MRYLSCSKCAKANLKFVSIILIFSRTVEYRNSPFSGETCDHTVCDITVKQTEGLSLSLSPLSQTYAHAHTHTCMQTCTHTNRSATYILQLRFDIEVLQKICSIWGWAKILCVYLKQIL